VEHVSDWAREAPMILVAVARPELLDARPTWAGGKLNATSILLEALSEDESERLIDALLADARFTASVRRRVVEAAEGNPLFVEQMLAMAGEDGANGEPAVPPTIQALLAARLERLARNERATVERASIVGKEFSLAELRELSPPEERTATADRVLALVRKELMRPAHAAEGDDVFRFRHLLIRDAAYEAMPKESRAELHERYADQLEKLSGDRAPAVEEIVGYPPRAGPSLPHRARADRRDRHCAGRARCSAGTTRESPTWSAISRPSFVTRVDSKRRTKPSRAWWSEWAPTRPCGRAPSCSGSTSGSSGEALKQTRSRPRTA
jgi:hypothetical protein